MKYLEWNNILGRFFFLPDNEGTIITLVISEEDIIEIGRSSGKFPDNVFREEILDSFKREWRKGYPGTTGNIIEKINQEDCKGFPFYKRGKDSFNCMNILVEYPPTFMHLIGINLAILEESSSSRYHRIRKYFGLSKSEFPNMHEGLNWNKSWDNLIWWSNQFKGGSLGLLPDRSLSSEKFEYMGKPYLFILLSKKQLYNFTKYFFDKDAEPKSQISDRELINAFEQVQGNSDILELITSGEETDAKQTALAILRQLYCVWDGKYEVEGEFVKSFYQSRKLRICFSIEATTGYADFCFRFKEDIYFNSEIAFNNERVIIHPNHWSSPISINNIFENKILKDDSIGLKAVFKPTEKRIFVFTNGRQEGLHSSIYIEVDQIQYSGNQFILLHSDIYPQISAWLGSNGALNKTDDLLDKSLIYKGFLLYYFDGFTKSFKGIDKLNLPSNKTLRFSFGLKGNLPSEWISGFPVLGTLIGARGSEKLLLKGNKVYEFDLIDGMIFKIPFDIIPGSYYIEIANDIDSTFLLNGDKIKFLDLNFSLFFGEELGKYVLNEENDKHEMQNYYSAHHVLSNVSSNYASPPQFYIWSREIVNIEKFESNFQGSITFMEYLSYKSTMSKEEFGQSISAVFENYSNSKEQGDINKLNSYTLNALRESCRVEMLFNKDGFVSRIYPVRPFIFRLGNFQNFSLSKLRAGMQPFGGAMYALGGVYSFDIIRCIHEICKASGALLNIYKESSTNALIPASIFIYEEHGSEAIKLILKLLGQPTAYPYFNFIRQTVSLLEQLENYCQSRQLDLHIESRYQYFDIFSLRFKKDGANFKRNYPSLSLYEINPWQKYFILRFCRNEVPYNISVDPRWGKYIILYLRSIDNLFYFDVEKNMLAVPSLLRLPVEFERNLFFFTGRLPARCWLIETGVGLSHSEECSKGARSYLIYKGVLKNTVERIADKVGQKLNMKPIDTP